MNNFSAKPLVESALLAALGAAMMLVAWYVPVVGVAVGLVAPLPLAVAVMRHGMKWGILSSFVAMLALALFVGWISALGLWVVNGAMGLSFGFAVSKGFRPTLVLVSAALGSLVALIAEFASAYFLMGLTLGKQLDEMMVVWSQALEMNRKLFGDNPVIDDFAAILTDKAAIVAVLPGVVFMAAFMLAYVNFEIFRRVLPRLGYSLEGLPPFSRWIFPEIVAFLGLFASLTTIALTALGYDIPILHQILNNIAVVTSLLFFIEALAVGVFYLLRAGVSRAMTGLLTIVAITVVMGPGPWSPLATLFGMIDVLFDFRRVRFEPVGEI